MVLDPKKTHESNPDCPSRLLQNPQGQWYCIDCGLHIMWKTAKVVLVNGTD